MSSHCLFSRQCYFTVHFLWQVGGKAALYGLECNVSSPGAVTRLANAAASQMGSIDVWINNAGYSGRYQVLPALESRHLFSSKSRLSSRVHLYHPL